MSDPNDPALLRTATLSERKPTRFRLLPDAPARRAMAADLGLLSLGALRLEGEIQPVGRRDFRLVARLQADAVQPCVVTLAPVPAHVDEEVALRFAAEIDEPEGDEIEMPDENLEPLPEVIDLRAVAAEALMLALPMYPRAPGAELGEAVHAEPGTAPLRDSDLKPFAGLAALKDRLSPPGSPPADGPDAEDTPEGR